MKKAVAFVLIICVMLPCFCSWEYKQNSVKDDFGDEIRKEDYYINGKWGGYYTDKFILFFFDDYSMCNGYLSFGGTGYKSPESYSAKLSIKEENDNVVSYSVEGKTSSNGSYWNVLLSLDFLTVCEILDVFERNDTVKIVIYFGKNEESYNYGAVSLDGFRSDVSCIRNGHKGHLIADEKGVYTSCVCSICGKETLEGAKGPAGGFLVYDKGEYSDGWRYLEAAPENLWVKDGIPTVDSYSSEEEEKYYNTSYFIFGYFNPDITKDHVSDRRSGCYVNGTKDYNANDCTGTGIGDGKRNTEMLVSAMGGNAYYNTWINNSTHGWRVTEYYAARLCSILKHESKGVVYDDWFLPSKDELNLMYENNIIDRYKYWSSSEDDIYPGNAYAGAKEQRDEMYSVRPMRAF